MTKEDVTDVNIVAHLLTFIEKEAYSLLKSLALSEKPISPPYATFNELLLDYVRCTNFEFRKRGKFRKMIHRDIENSTTSLRHPKPVSTQDYADNLPGCNAVRIDGHKFGQCLSSGRFHSLNSCAFHNFKCGEIGEIQSVYNTEVRSAAPNAKLCNYDPIKFDASNYHLSLFTTSKRGIESHSSPELNETHNHCETKVSNKSTSYQISHVIVPDMVCPSYSYISDEISYKSEENMLSDSNHDRKPGAVLMNADFSYDSSLFNDILNKFEENISEESTPDVISHITYPHNAFASCGKLGQCET
ncbi:unnamed protein product [Schistosoma curassoni]|uniref:LisH domain-containing protein n=1 Tax=Schistosoma curassoni TaxID=6186 RepID=A0A183L2I1_9TREM|nr:unnamed protein product [Schistosoma curassoni]